MSDKMKKYARAIQDAIDTDPALEKKNYTWCLRMVRENIDAVNATIDKSLPNQIRREMMIAELIDRIKPLAGRRS